MKQETYFQSHHTGIEIREAMIQSKFRNTFNRTILELKFTLEGEDYYKFTTFNRTILELK